MTSPVSSVHARRLAALGEKRRRLETLAEEKALEVLLSDPEALPLVHSFPEEDFFLLMHRIGPDDFLPVLAMASDPQWRFVMDLECWQGEDPDYGAMALWFQRFLQADPRRFVRFMVEEEGDLMDAWLFRNVEVRIREHDEDSSEFPDDFRTFDDVLYFRLRPLPREIAEDTEKAVARDAAVSAFAHYLAELSHPLFFRVFQEMAWSIPAELEEMALHWRRSRMAEKGFSSREEALRLFLPLREGELEGQGRRSFFRQKDGEAPIGVPEHGKRMAEGIADFSDALILAGAGSMLQDLELELAHLCNRFIAATGKVVRSRELLDGTGRAVTGYLQAGISRIAGEDHVNAEVGARILRTYRLDAVFRAGFGPVMRLKWRAEQWRREAWFRKSGLALSFWEEEGMGLLGGLFLDVPLRFDAGATGGQFYRPFASDGEIRAAERAFSDLAILDDLMALLGLSEVEPMGRLLTWKNLLLTLWISDRLEGTEDKGILQPVHEERFRAFFSRMREVSDAGFCFSAASREDFLFWLSRRTGLSAAVLGDRVGGILERLFQEVDTELRAIAPEALDHRYIRFFLLRPV